MRQSLKPREEHKLRVFENRVLRRGIGGGLERRPHNEDIYNLYVSPDNC
jgi:hypothetical protein